MIEKDIYFEVMSVLNKNIRTTKEYWDKIIQTKHPVMQEKEEDIKETLKGPDEIRKSKRDKNVILYYKMLKKRYICVVVRHQNNKGYIITVYPTKEIKEGEIIWKK